MTWRPLVWLDTETGGLDPKTDALLELGIIITDENLIERHTWRGIASTRQTGKVGDFARKMHEASGLLAECEAVTTPPDVMCAQAAEWLRRTLMMPTHGKDFGPMCGSSVHFDRSFLQVYSEDLVGLFSYRNLDVSSIKECFTKVLGKLDPSADWPKAHTALDDVRRSIRECAIYAALMDGGIQSRLHTKES